MSSLIPGASNSSVSLGAPSRRSPERTNAAITKNRSPGTGRGVLTAFRGRNPRPRGAISPAPFSTIRLLQKMNLQVEMGYVLRPGALSSRGDLSSQDDLSSQGEPISQVDLSSGGEECPLLSQRSAFHLVPFFSINVATQEIHGSFKFYSVPILLAPLGWTMTINNNTLPMLFLRDRYTWRIGDCWSWRHGL